MKKYARSKTPDELAAACKKAGIAMNTERYDAGSDWITLSGKFDDRELELITSTFNGNFIAKVGDDLVTERHDHLDNQGWYVAIMDLLYVAKGNEPKVSA